MDSNDVILDSFTTPNRITFIAYRTAYLNINTIAGSIATSISIEKDRATTGKYFSNLLLL